MLDQARQHTSEFQFRLKDAGIDTALIADESSIAYLKYPEWKSGDKSVLRAWITFAAYGGSSVDSELVVRIGDSIVVTEIGIDYRTRFPRKSLMRDR